MSRLRLVIETFGQLATTVMVWFGQPAYVGEFVVSWPFDNPLINRHMAPKATDLNDLSDRELVNMDDTDSKNKINF